MKRLALMLFALLALTTGSAHATGVWAVVTQISASSAPGTIVFQINPVQTCTAYSYAAGWVTYNSGNVDTNKAVYAAALLSMLGGRSVFVSYDPSNCVVNGFNLN